ncbi:MAG: DUF2591 family protein [Polaromonas sp.]|nr:DUF2591 family protein [Polaromonas sp.]
MKVKVATATGPTLDLMVAIALGRYEKCIRDESRLGVSITDIGLDEHGLPAVYVPGKGKRAYVRWAPSSDWGQGGPIKEQARIISGPHGLNTCAAQVAWDASKQWLGPTELVAAMRCFVTNELGNVVDLPQEFAWVNG